MSCPLSYYSFLASIVETSCETESATAEFSDGSISPPVTFSFSATIVIEGTDLLVCQDIAGGLATNQLRK